MESRSDRGVLRAQTLANIGATGAAMSEEDRSLGCRIRLMLLESGPTCVAISSGLTVSGPRVVAISNRSTVSANLAQIWSLWVRIWPKPAEARPTPAKFGQVGSDLARTRPNPVNVGRFRPNVAPVLVDFRPNLGCIWPTLSPIWMFPARFRAQRWPMSDKFGRVWPKSQIWPNFRPSLLRQKLARIQ